MKGYDRWKTTPPGDDDVECPERCEGNDPDCETCEGTGYISRRQYNEETAEIKAEIEFDRGRDEGRW